MPSCLPLQCFWLSQSVGYSCGSWVKILAAYAALIGGAFGSVSGLLATLTMIPPNSVGLGICISFRGGVINIGGEGQLIIGALRRRRRCRWRCAAARLAAAPYQPAGWSNSRCFLGRHCGRAQGAA